MRFGLHFAILPKWSKNGISSFLFSLNKDLDLDSTRRGNKAKYANCNSKNPNMTIRMMTVKGDHRVGLYAKRNILAGEELDFDYGYGKEEGSRVPAWFDKSKIQLGRESAKEDRNVGSLSSSSSSLSSSHMTRHKNDRYEKRSNNKTRR